MAWPEYRQEPAEREPSGAAFRAARRPRPWSGFRPSAGGA